jgi:recombination protein RecA
MDSATRQMRLESIIHELERRFGSGIVYLLANARPKLGARSVSTGSLGLDWITGVGGIPRGRITTLDGPDSSGKSTISYHVLANAQAEGGLAAFLDAEHSADPAELLACGVDFADLILGLPGSAVEALEMAEILARSAALDAIVVSALPRPYPSWLLAEASRRLLGALAGTPTACLFVGLAGGGKAQPTAFASLALQSRPIRPLVQLGGAIAGLRVRVEVAKNKLDRPGGAVELEVLEGKGISRPAELFDLGVAHGLIEKLSIGPTYAGQLLGKGRTASMDTLARDPELAGQLAADLRRVLVGGASSFPMPGVALNCR